MKKCIGLFYVFLFCNFVFSQKKDTILSKSKEKEIEAVVIFPYKDLKRSIANIDYSKNIYNKLGFKLPKESLEKYRKPLKQPGVLGSIINGDVVNLINNVSGRNKKMYDLKMYEQKQEIIEDMVVYLGEGYFIDDLALEQEKMRGFCQYILMKEPEQLKLVMEESNILKLMSLMESYIVEFKGRLEE